MQSRIYIPVEKDDIIQSTINELCDAAGGCTAVPAAGFWKNDQGQVIRDNIWLVFATHELAAQQAVDRVLYRAADKLLQAGEQAVLIEHDSTPELLDQHSIQRYIVPALAAA